MRIVPIVQRIAILTVITAISALMSWPQASTGSVQGTVRDHSGAIVPNARVELANTGTGVSAVSTTNEVGFYLFPGISPGQYRLVAEAPGMQKFQGEFPLRVQQHAVVDVVLDVGQLTESVTVQEIMPLITVNSPALGSTLERQRIEQLPINGRSILNLMPAIPGLEAANDYGSNGTRAYGLRQGSHEFVLDGAALTERMWGGVQRRPPGLDTIQEFKVESNNSSARYTRPLTVVMSTKSGTNAFHGSLFETNRNNAYGKARAREDFYEKAPFLNRNEFGASAGGPVFIPKMYDGRNRTFWFFAYEAHRSVAPRTMGFAVPTAAMRSGDFQGLVDNAGRQIRIFDPWTTNPQTWERQQFAYQGRPNVIDPNRISPLARTLFDLTPMPTMPDVNPLVENNWFGTVPNTNRQWTTSLRVDQNFTDNDRFYARYSQGDATSFAQFGSIPLPDSPANTNQRTSPNKNLALSWVRTISPTLFNELLVSGSREVWMNSTGGQEKYADTLGLPNPHNSVGWPGMGSTGLSNYSFTSDNRIGTALTSVVLDNNTTKIAGRHEIHFGGRYRHDQMNILADQQAPWGSHDFNTSATALYNPSSNPANPVATPLTGHNLANMALSVMNYRNRFVRGYYYLRGREYSLYLQDNIRVNSRLTLNLGLRYEYWPAFTEKNDNLVSFDPSQRAIVLGQDLQEMYAFRHTLPAIVETYQAQGVRFISRQDAGFSRSMFHTSKANFGPRLGFAYRLGDKANSSVLRGGYRMSYFPMPHRTWTGGARSATPLTAQFTDLSNVDAVQAPDGIALYGMRSIPTVIGGVNSRDVISLDEPRSLTRGSATVSYFAPDQSEPRVQDWNLTFEKQILESMVARASYIGNNVQRLEQVYSYNQQTPAYIWYASTGERLPTGEFASVATRAFDQQVYGDLAEYTNTGWSNFNGVQLELERRFNKGYAFHVFYLMSNALTAGGRSWSGTMPELNQFMPGIVPAGFDERNRFLNYARDITVPKHRVSWNWLVGMPFGKGKLFGGNAGKGLDRIIGGWQIAGIGSFRTNYFTLPATMFPTGQNVEIYGTQHPIQDCRSGRCVSGYLWWNGYIRPQDINTPNGIQGVPANYRPAVQPLNPWPETVTPGDPMLPFYGTNTTWVPLNDGSQQQIAYNNGLLPLRNQFAPGVPLWGLDASVFKVIPITEQVRLRFNADFFNVLNRPGIGNSVADTGIVSTQFSGQSPREIQLTLRLSW